MRVTTNNLPPSTVNFEYFPKFALYRYMHVASVGGCCQGVALATWSPFSSTMISLYSQGIYTSWKNNVPDGISAPRLDSSSDHAGAIPIFCWPCNWNKQLRQIERGSKNTMILIWHYFLYCSTPLSISYNPLQLPMSLIFSQQLKS